MVDPFQVVTRLNNLIGYLPLSTEEVYRALARELSRGYPGSRVTIHALRDGLLVLEAMAEGGAVAIPAAPCHRSDRATDCAAARDGLPVVVQDAGESAPCTNRVLRTGTRAYVCVPVVGSAGVHGVLSLDHPDPRAFSRAELDMLLAVANQAAMAVQRAELYRSLERERAELKRTCRELERAHARLTQSEKMAAVGKLAAGVAHEINNPTAIIMSRLDLLLDEATALHLPPSFVEDLRVVSRQVSRIAEICRGLLSFARPAPMERSRVDLNRVVRETALLFRGRCDRRGISLELELDDRLPPVAGNANRLQQVLVNLLDNAEAAVGEKGRIRIISRTTGGGEAEVLVHDSGPGIPAEVLPYIFLPFFSTKEARQGTGLGLAVSYNIIREHGGILEGDNHPAGGAVFRLRLPPADPCP